MDDAGAGVANFNHIVELRPDVLKIDISLVRSLVAMMIGMPLFGMPLRALQGALLGPSSVGIPELRALGMAISMTVAMVAWTRFRGHSWRASAEMAAAMIVPTLALFSLSCTGLIAARGQWARDGLDPAGDAPGDAHRRREYGL